MTKKPSKHQKKQFEIHSNDSITSDSNDVNPNAIVSKTKRSKRRQQSKGTLDEYSHQGEEEEDKSKRRSRSNITRSMKKTKLESSQDISLASVVADFEDKHTNEEDKEGEESYHEEQSFEKVGLIAQIFTNTYSLRSKE